MVERRPFTTALSHFVLIVGIAIIAFPEQAELSRFVIDQNGERTTELLTVSIAAALAGDASANIALTAMSYTGAWNASGQIPTRLVGQPYEGRVFDQFDPGLRQNWHQHHFGSPPAANSSERAGHTSWEAATISTSTG